MLRIARRWQGICAKTRRAQGYNVIR